MVKMLQKRRHRRNIIKAIYDKLTENVYVNNENFKQFLLNQEQDKSVH